MTQSYTGHLPYTDEGVERSLNSEHLQVGTFGAKQVVLYDSSGNEVVSSTTLPSNIVSGKTTVTTALTAVRLSVASVTIKGIWLNASLAGIVCVVGNSSVVATAGSENGIILIPGNNPVFLEVSELNTLWVDSVSNGGVLAWSYMI